jgi:hypothetical protein
MVRTILLALVAAAAFAQGLGKWKVNLAKSSYDPGPPPVSETYTFEAAPGGEISTRVWIGRDGQHVTNRTVLNFDGKWYPFAGHRHADEICTREISDHIVVSSFKRKGQVVLTGTRVISDDGKVITMVLDGTGVDGKIHTVRVLERQ